MKKIIIAAVFCLAAGMAQAQEAPAASGSLINFGDFFAKARAGYSVNQHMEKSTVIYSAVQRFHTLAGIELGNVNSGYDTTNKHPIIMTGIRADNLIPMIWGGSWGKTHVTTAELPAIEFGPYASAWPTMDDGKVTVNFSYGVIFAIGFAK